MQMVHFKGRVWEGERCLSRVLELQILSQKDFIFLNPPRPRADACSGRDDGERRKGEERNGGEGARGTGDRTDRNASAGFQADVKGLIRTPLKAS